MAYTQALEGAQTVAVAEAQRLLQMVLAEIDGAQDVLDTSTTEAEAARAADAAAQKQLRLAEESAARTQREIADIRARAERTRHTLGAVAMEAYQGDSLATLGVVLSAETPNELADRYVGMRTLLRAGDSALGDLATDEANLRNAQARLEGQREERQKLADQAADTRATKELTEQAAQQAQAVLEDKGDKYQYALSLAEQARLEDYRRYMELLNESTALGAALAGISYGPGYGSGTFVRPGTGATTSEYGPRLHPILGYVKIHTGLDFGLGDRNIYAADSGTVVEAKWNNAYGNMVVIDHGEFNGHRLTTMYAHQPGLMVSEGQRVEKGQVIGRIGSTGYSTGPHLHFEVRLDGQHTDPWPWVKAAPAPR
ncbi:MAG TPA: peptidoglycan DD-metalloendopeptidase family protein [Jiangellaceae bacterium]|nr:peptidoglycan DD-metalloendopeptidase family protein [Jiangellaceae bacterium]